MEQNHSSDTAEVFRAVVFKLLVWCGVQGYVPGL